MTDSRPLPRARSADDTARGVLSTLGKPRTRDYYRAVARLGVEAAEALEHAHASDVIHRDIKPANLMLDARGHLWLTDFGLARTDRASGLTMTGDVVGTLRYMSPEQALAQRGAVDARSDIYSLGATLFELATLAPVFDGQDKRELLRQIAVEDPRPPRRILPAELETILLAALEKAPGDRYDTAQDMADDLRRYLDDRPIRARKPSFVQCARKWSRRHKPAVAAALVCLLGLVAAVAGSVGWSLNDRATRTARIDAEALLGMKEAERLRDQGRFSQALEIAKRAHSMLESGAQAPSQRADINDLVRDLTLARRLEDARLSEDRSHPSEPRFHSELALPEFEAAFAEYGIDAEQTTAPQAAGIIRARPRAIQATVIAALDRWDHLARKSLAGDLDKAKRGSQRRLDWLQALVAQADTDGWRKQVREAIKSNDWDQLSRLAETGALNDQASYTLQMLGGSLCETAFRDAGLNVLRRAQHQYPEDFWVNYTLSYHLGTDSRQSQEAIRFATAAMVLYPESVAAWLILGSHLGDAGRFDEAIVAHRKAIELQPNLPLPHANLANALRQKGLLDESIAESRKAIRLEPGLAHAHSSLGDALWQKGHWDEAIAAFRMAIKLAPGLVMAHNNLGMALRSKGLEDEGIAEFREAIRLEPGSAETHSNLGIALAVKGLPDEAIAEFREAIELKPGYAIGHNNLATALQGNGLLDEAIAEFREAIRLEPRNVDMHSNLGDALGEKGLKDEAIAEYHKAIELEPDNDGALSNIGGRLIDMGLLDEAIADLRKSIALKPDDAGAHYNLASALGEKGLPDEGIAEYHKAIELKPDWAAAHCNLGLMHLRQGDGAAALKALRKGHELGSRSPNWSAPSARWLAEAEQVAVLEARLPDVLAGRFEPASPSEKTPYSELCYTRKLFASSARLYAGTLAADATLAADPETFHRYSAACAAALAGAGMGDEAAALDVTQRGRSRADALAWLRADLAQWKQKLAAGSAATGSTVAETLQHWQSDSDLAGLRDPEQLAELSADESAACEALWQDVRETLGEE